MALLNVNAFDRQYYEENLKDFLPGTFVDCHTHIWLEKFLGDGKMRSGSQNWLRLGLTKQDVEKIFYSNSARIFGL